MKKQTLNEQLSRIKGMMKLNEATDEEVAQYNKKVKNSSMVLNYVDRLYGDRLISREVFLDFKKALNNVLKRYHNEINGREMGIDEQYEFDDFDTQITPEEMTYNGDESFERAQRIASDILSDVVNRPIDKYSIFEDDVFDGGEVMFAFGNEEGTLYYYFDVNFSSQSSYSPSSYYEPSSHSDAEYDLKPKYMKVIDNSNEVLYKGNDFTNIMDVTLSNGKDVEEYVYDKFDERIQIYSDENPDERDPDDYRDMRDGY